MSNEPIDVVALRAAVLAAVPTSWLDPLLSGPDSDPLPLDGIAVECLLLNLRARLGEVLDAALVSPP
jgi:hypothetical protein